MGRPKKKQKKGKMKADPDTLKVKMKPMKARAGSIKMKLQKVKAESDYSDDEEASPPRPAHRGGKTKHPYQGYSPDDLLAAVRAVKEQGMSVYKAAELYGVPKSTVHDKVIGKSNILFQRKGPAPLLSYDDEKKLVDYLLQMSALGYMFTVTELRNLASELAVQKGKLCEGSRLSPRWHKSFRVRWPVLNEKVFGNFRTCDHKKREEKKKKLETFEFEEDGDQVQISTMADEMDVCLSNYYTELHSVLVKYELLDKPQRIFCIDEVAIQYESGNPKAKQIKSLSQQVTSRSETTVVSLIGCGNAIGNALPPYLIYPGRQLSPEMFQGKYPGVQGTVTETGLTDYNTLKLYLEKHFVEYALLGMKKNPPVLVLYDGTKSKVNPDTIAWAKNHNIVLFVWPPNSTNLTYPLERGCFQYFKDVFLKETRIFRELYNVDSISKSAICKIVSEAYPQALSMRNLVEIFGDAGIYPYKPTIALCEELRNERMDRKNKMKAITRRPPGMKDKGVQVYLKDDGALKLLKQGGKRKAIYQEDASVVTVDSTAVFLRDKKIQKMLESNSHISRPPREEEFSESEEEYEEELEEVEEEPEEFTSPPATSGSYYLMETAVAGSHPVDVSTTTACIATETTETTTSTPHLKEELQNSGNDLKIEETHTYALSPTACAAPLAVSQKASEPEPEMDTIEQTRVAVQALQDIANEIQYISATTMQNNCAVQNVTLNSGRMIQVVMQPPGGGEDGVVPIQEVGGVEPVIEEVQQIEIDSSVESIIPLAGDIIENC